MRAESNWSIQLLNLSPEDDYQDWTLVFISDEKRNVEAGGMGQQFVLSGYSRRHDAELGAIATTSLPFGKFNQIFANDAIAHAIVDRLVNEAEVFYMEGDSYRPHQRQEKLKQKNPAFKSNEKKLE